MAKTATTQKLVVQVVDARNLLPKDGHGTSSPYVVVDYYGQRKRTETVIRDLNPAWNQSLEFNVVTPSEVFDDVLELSVFHDKNYGPTRRNNFLGRLRLRSSQFVKKGEEALMYLPLEKKDWFSWIRGDIGLKIYFADVEEKSNKTETEPEPAPAPESVPESAAAAGNDEGKPDKPELEPEPEPEPAAAIGNVEEKIYKDEAETAAATGNDGGKPDKAEPCLPQRDMMSKALPQVKFGLMNGDESENKEGIERRSSLELVEKMHYVFVRVVKARSLTTDSPLVKISVSNHTVRSEPARRNSVFFEWDQTFAFSRNSSDSSPILEISMWGLGSVFIGGVRFDATEIPLRDPPDSPLAPQWYRLEGGVRQGDIMLATWVGTQADESFPDAWKTDTAGNHNARAKVYQSPKLWYLRATVIEAQDVVISPSKDLVFLVKAQLGFQAIKTKPATSRTGAPSWNDKDLVFVAAEPFAEDLLFTIETRQLKVGTTTMTTLALGSASVPLTAVERRVDDRKVASSWFELDTGGRLHLRLCFDGGYHVMDEQPHASSDFRPTARQLWKPPLGSVELGIISCKNLVPVKTVGGRGCTDAYCVAKYGPKWVRTRTVSNSLDPKWNEQYTFEVFDPCTVLTLGVFDTPCVRIGKIHIRISTLAAGKAYRNTYPLLVLTPAGTKKTGEIELAIRFLTTGPTLDLLNTYTQPMLPLMHHTNPLGAVQQDALRDAAARLIAARLSRSEPPLPNDVVAYILDVEPKAFSMRQLRANYMRIARVARGLTDAVRWADDTRTWKNPTATMLVHALLVMLIWFPDLIIPTLFLHVFVIGAWNYRLRGKDPVSYSEVDSISVSENEELDEELDAMPSCRPLHVVRARYDKLRTLGARVQAVLGELASEAERVQALVKWRDPRATGLFLALCFALAMVLYLVSPKMVAMSFGFYCFRHPLFRDRSPSPALNFFRRLPSFSDRLL